MVIPYANRTGINNIPELALKDQPALRMGEIHRDLFKIIPRAEFSKAVSCVQFMGRNKLHITFESPTKMEDIIHHGLTIRNQPISITPFSTKKWVRISRVPYGTPVAHIQKTLDVYGDSFSWKKESLNGIATGEIAALMEIKQPIPSKIMVNGHSSLVFYPGQKQTCFLCNGPDHRSAQCPQRNPVSRPNSTLTGAPSYAVALNGRPPSPQTLLNAESVNEDLVTTLVEPAQEDTGGPPQMYWKTPRLCLFLRALVTAVYQPRRKAQPPTPPRKKKRRPKRKNCVSRTHLRRLSPQSSLQGQSYSWMGRIPRDLSSLWCPRYLRYLKNLLFSTWRTLPLLSHRWSRTL